MPPRDVVAMINSVRFFVSDWVSVKLFSLSLAKWLHVRQKGGLSLVGAGGCSSTVWNIACCIWNRRSEPRSCVKVEVAVMGSCP